MSLSDFSVQVHKVAGQHLREYSRANRHGEQDVQWLEVKQYTPTRNGPPQDGDVTILAAHAVSFPKEMLEPFFHDLLRYAQGSFRVRSIWIADMANHGASSVLNEATLGDDPSFSDLSRDLLHLTNVFREQMPQPIVGIGHSMGGTALVELALIHPRLMASVVLLDPVIGASILTAGTALIYSSSIRADLWPSREAAEAFFRKIRALSKWDPRCMDLWLKHGLRDTPTLLYPERGKVTLTTPKAQESWSYGRSIFEPLPSDGGNDSREARVKYPDAPAGLVRTLPFYRAEAMKVYNDLPRLRPDALYVFPANSPMTDADGMDEKANMTGSGAGGSGGVKHGRVAKVIIPHSGHLCPFEKPDECGRAVAEWLGANLEAWAARKAYEHEHADNKSVDRIALSREWMELAKLAFDRHGPGAARAAKASKL